MSTNVHMLVSLKAFYSLVKSKQREAEGNRTIEGETFIFLTAKSTTLDEISPYYRIYVINLDTFINNI